MALVADTLRPAPAAALARDGRGRSYVVGQPSRISTVVTSMVVCWSVTTT
jgi:hypothetical protein